MTSLLRRAAASVVVPLAAAAVLAGATTSAEAVEPATGSASTTAAATALVNIRAGAGTSQPVLGSLERGARVEALGAARAGWVPVRFRGASAYVSAAYLRVGGALPAGPVRTNPVGLKVTTMALNLRSGPSVAQPVVATLPEGTTLTLTTRQQGGFAETSVGGRLRWVSLAYLANLGRPASSTAEAPGEVALAFARRQLGEPYRYGATGPDSWDCSGLTQAAWRAAGVSIPRTSQQQFAHGPRIARSALRPGDLVFFYGPKPHHVGLYVGSGKIINAPRPGKTVSYTTISSMPYAGAVRPG